MSNTDDYKLKCDAIIVWASRKKGKQFDISFVESVLQFIDNADHITDRQAECIDTIITKFKIEI